MEDRRKWLAGVDYEIIHTYLYKIGYPRWGCWVGKCNYTNKFFVMTSLGPFGIYGFCSMHKKYETLPDKGYRFDSEREALVFMKKLSTFFEVKSILREKALQFRVKDVHLKQPYLVCEANNWDDYSAEVYLEDICTQEINPKKHKLLEWELTLIFNFLGDKLEENNHDSFQISQVEFFQKALELGGHDSINSILDNYSHILKAERNHRQFWCFQEHTFTRLVVWNDNPQQQKLVMSLAFLKR
jgi:hypothetical protein